MTFLIPAMAGGFIKTFHGAYGSASKTFAGVPFGDEDANRYIVVGSCFGGSGAEPSTCTIAGGSASLVQNSGGSRRAQLWIRNVPSGASGTITLTGSGDGSAICVWSLYPMFNPAAFSSTNTNGASLTVPSGGIGFGVCYTSSSTTPSIAWLSGMTEDGASDFNIGSNTGLISGASTVVPGTYAVSAFADPSGSGFVTASFEP